MRRGSASCAGVALRSLLPRCVALAPRPACLPQTRSPSRPRHACLLATRRLTRPRSSPGLGLRRLPGRQHLRSE
eukprot:5795026-Alexandrium_andersonii.AAC.1